MIHVKMKHIRLFMMGALCLHSVTTVASEGRMPVPPSLYGTSYGISTVVPGNYNIFSKNFMVSCSDKKKEILIIATMIVVASIVYYVYQQRYLHKAKDQALAEMNSYIDTLKAKLDYCIDSIPMPYTVKEYFKKSLAQSIAECVANGRNAAQRYIQKNKKYFISLTAAPTGVFFGYPVTGGALAMLGVVYGAVQSAREEIAEFRQETEKLFAETNKHIREGFQNVESNAENNKQEVLQKIETEVGSLFQQIENITGQINQLRNDVGDKVDCVGEKVEALSGELREATEQMIRLHSDRDKKDDELVAKLEDASNKLAGAKEDFIVLVEKMMEESAAARKKEFDAIQRQLLAIETKETEQAEVLSDVQSKISMLLDTQENNDKQFVQLLDSVRSSNLSLEEMQGNAQRQEKVLMSFSNILDDVQMKIQKNREDLLGAIATSVEQCSTLSGRVQQLETTVKSNHSYTVNGFEQISEQNAELKKMIERMQQEKEELFVELNAMKDEQKKTNLFLEQLIKNSDNTDKNVDRLIGFTQKYDKRNANKNNKKLSYNSSDSEYQFCPNFLDDGIKHQLRLANNTNNS